MIFSETSDTLLLSTGDTSTLFTEISDTGKATGFGGVNNVGLGFNSRKVKLILGFWELSAMIVLKIVLGQSAHYKTMSMFQSKGLFGTAVARSRKCPKLGCSCFP